MIEHVGIIGLAQHAGSEFDILDTLHIFDTDIQQANRGPLDMEQDARHCRTHHSQIDKMAGIGTDGGANIQHDAFAARSRPDPGNRGAVNPRQRAQAEGRHRHQRTGIARRNRHIRFTEFHRLDRAPHRRHSASMPQGHARLGIHGNRYIAMVEGCGLGQLGMRIEQRQAQGRIAKHNKDNAWMALQC